MAFEHNAPEQAGKTPMARMRLHDMRRAAAAFDIPIDHSAIADKVRPTLKDQEAMGTFKQPCPHPERLTPQGYAEFIQEGAKVEAGPTKEELLAKIAELESAKSTPEVKAETKPEPSDGVVKWRGPAHKWCKKSGDDWITGFDSKEIAEAA